MPDIRQLTDVLQCKLQHHSYCSQQKHKRALAVNLPAGWPAGWTLAHPSPWAGPRRPGGAGPGSATDAATETRTLIRGEGGDGEPQPPEAHRPRTEGDLSDRGHEGTNVGTPVTGTRPDSALRGGPWVKSSLSYANGNCVEVSDQPGGAIGVRNSRDREGPVLRFTRDEWTAFLGGVRNGEFDDFGRIRM
jgi:hypothetical protein